MAILLLQYWQLFRCTWKKNKKHWLVAKLVWICLFQRGCSTQVKQQIWRGDGGTWARLPFLGHSTQGTVAICTCACLRLRGTELLSPDFGHRVTPLTPDQIKQIEGRSLSSCDLWEPSSAPLCIHGILHPPSYSASSFTLPLSLSFSLKIWVTLLTLAQICPMKTTLVQSPRAGIKWGLMLRGERRLSVHRNSVLSVWGEYIDKSLRYFFFRVFQIKFRIFQTCNLQKCIAFLKCSEESRSLCFLRLLFFLLFLYLKKQNKKQHINFLLLWKQHTFVCAHCLSVSLPCPRSMCLARVPTVSGRICHMEVTLSRSINSSFS